MLPNLLVIGAQKCGTTSLHYYLGLHPQIVMSKEKELEFFIDRKNWAKGLEWYASHFKGKATIRGESSPNYTNYPHYLGVPARMHAVLPAARLIYMVRDPIERMISQYVHQFSDNREHRSLAVALGSLDDNEYLYRSLYYMQLQQYLEYYSASQILVISAEDLRDHRSSTLRRVFEFLEVDANFYSRCYALRRHRSARKRRKTALGMRIAQAAPTKLLQRLPQVVRWPVEDLLFLPFSHQVERPELAKELRARLVERLRKDVEQLRAFSGCGFRNWCL
jgi:hypothetical protein